jgi:hypothetical protein
MAEIRSHGLCVMGCGRKATHRQRMYCERCYNTWRRGGFDKVPYRVRVRAARDPKTGKIIRKAYTRTQWKSPEHPPGYISVLDAKRQLDNRPRCTEAECNNLARHNRDGKCDKHNVKAAARVKRYQAEGRIKDANAKYRSKQRQAA